IVQRVLVPLAEAHVRIIETALQKKVRKRAHQILGTEAEVVTGIARIADPFHWYCLRAAFFGSSPGGSRRRGSAMNPASSLRLMRRCAYRPSRMNSAADARRASGSLTPKPSFPVFSSKP